MLVNDTDKSSLEKESRLLILSILQTSLDFDFGNNFLY